MARGIGGKIYLAVLGKVHELVDRTCNTPEAYAQSIRELEKATAELLSSKDEAVGTKVGISQKISRLEVDIAKDNADINLLLSDDDDTNDSLAIPTQIRVSEKEVQLEELRTAEVEAQENVDQLQMAVDKCKKKLDEMTRNLSKIKMAATSAEAKNKAAAAIETALGATDSIGSIDAIENKINAKANVADARFKRVVGDMNTPSAEEAIAIERAKAALAARKAKLAE